MILNVENKFLQKGRHKIKKLKISRKKIHNYFICKFFGDHILVNLQNNKYA